MDLDHSTYTKLAAYIAGELPVEEKALLEQEMEKDMHLKQVYYELSNTLSHIPKELPDFDSNTAFKNLTKNLQEQGDLFQSSTALKVTKKVEPQKNIYANSFFKIAATLLILITSWFFMQWFINQDKATSNIVYRNEGQEPKRLLLADGSEVWLNVGSTITYNNDFAEKRIMTLNGEAYFNVIHNPKKTFQINLDGGEICVLGTSFNVQALAGSNEILTTVVEGKVTYKSEGDSKLVLLQKGDQFTWDKEKSTANIKKINTPIQMAQWRFKHLIFVETPFIEVMKKIESIFGAEITIESKALEGCKITSDFSGKTLEEMLLEIDFVFDTQSDINSKKIFIKGGNVCEN